MGSISARLRGVCIWTAVRRSLDAVLESRLGVQRALNWWWTRRCRPQDPGLEVPKASRSLWISPACLDRRLLRRALSGSRDKGIREQVMGGRSVVLVGWERRPAVHRLTRGANAIGADQGVARCCRSLDASGKRRVTPLRSVQSQQGSASLRLAAMAPSSASRPIAVLRLHPCPS